MDYYTFCGKKVTAVICISMSCLLIFVWFSSVCLFMLIKERVAKMKQNVFIKKEATHLINTCVLEKLT